MVSKHLEITAGLVPSAYIFFAGSDGSLLWWCKGLATAPTLAVGEPSIFCSILVAFSGGFCI